VIGRTTERWVVYASVAFVFVVAVAGIAYSGTPLPRFAMLQPIALFSVVMGNAASAIVLLETWRHYPKARATFVLALTFGVTALLALLSLLVTPPWAGAPAAFAAPEQAGPWLYGSWHVAAALGGLAYVLLRRHGGSPLLGRSFVVRWVALAGVFLATCISIALVFGDRLPILLAGRSLTGANATGLGPAVAVLLALATICAFAIRGQTVLDRMLAVSLLALTLDISVILISGVRYGASFYASRVLLMFGSTFVLASAVAALLGSRSKLAEVEATLTHVAREAAQRADRIRGLWRMSSIQSGSKEERLHTMLGIASATLRAAKPMFGALGHAEGDEFVLDAQSWAFGESAAHSDAPGAPAGARMPIARTLFSVLGTGESRTLYWEDLTPMKGRGMLFEAVGWQSFIGSPVVLGNCTYYVLFGSLESMTDEPFAEDDVAFVEVVASLVAGVANQETQFEQIQFDIEHDALTGLENRLQFRRAAREEIATRRPFAIAFVNLDGFRHVNEREGQAVGDDVLVAVAAGLKAVVPEAVVARMSADEFGVLIRDVDSVTAATAALDRYARVFAAPFHVGDGAEHRVLQIGASLGAARFPSDGSVFEEVVRRANVALDLAKARGASGAILFDRSMDAIVEASQLRYVELSNAIAADQLALVYQPTFVLATREINGAEALVRWDHPERGRLPPSEFVDFAERNGLMGPLSRWVLDRVARDIAGPGAVLPAGFRIYFNLGAEMLDDVPFISHLKDVLAAGPRLAAHLGVEVTETAAMENVERSMHTLELFRSWGLTIAIDDFGTGHSSLAYLKQLTVDVVKIDRSFVMGLPDDERDTALTDMLLRITDRFGFTTLAEGIETEAQAGWLHEHHCLLGQGYLISRPIGFEDLLNRVARERAPAAPASALTI
jgi:diguanylate cyclase (GGDEF)-like protein